MTISIPDTLTSDNSEKYIMSIRLRSGGLSFSGYDPSVGGSFFYREVEFDRAVSFISSLKDFFFSHEFLAWPYKRVDVVCVSPEYTLVPHVYFDETKCDELLNSVFQTKGSHGLSNELNDLESDLVFGLDEEVYEFCSRSLLHPYFKHYMTSLLKDWKRRSASARVRQMYVMLEQKRMDVVCFDQGKILFQNCLAVDHVNDIAYYLLYIWKHGRMDPETDQLLLAGKLSLRLDVINLLKVYLRHIDSVKMPSEMYLLGEDIVKVPMDLISQIICE